jgi:hypothetical protein
MSNSAITTRDQRLPLLARKLITEGNNLGLAVAIEVHRDTCGNAGENILSCSLRKATGELIPSCGTIRTSRREAFAPAILAATRQRDLIQRAHLLLTLQRSSLPVRSRTDRATAPGFSTTFRSWKKLWKPAGQCNP